MTMKGAFLLFSFFLFLQSCNTTEPPPNDSSITLALEDVASVEAWIKLTTNNLQLPTDVTLNHNDQTIETINLITSDTLLYIDSLLPNTTYNFLASSIQSAAGGPVSSNQLQVTTLDTTSHDINWKVETIGGSGSFAFDVAIISENDIWMVGEFQTAESDTPYNAAHWDGLVWELERIQINNFSGLIYPTQLTSIFAFSSSDIWVFSNAGSYGHFDGTEWSSEWIPQHQGTIRKIWGSSSNNVFFVGGNGSITKFNGSGFSLMNSGTDINLTDIYGTPDGSEVWACGWNSSDGRSVLLRLNGNNWETLWERNGNNNNLPYSSFMSTLWTSGRTEFLLTGIPDGIVRHSISNLDFAKKDEFAREIFTYRIRGDNTNNVYLAGTFSSIWHFNGASWKRYDYLLNQADRLRSIDVKNGIVVAVGSRFSGLLTGALVLVGRK